VPGSAGWHAGFMGSQIAHGIMHIIGPQVGLMQPSRRASRQAPVASHAIGMGGGGQPASPAGSQCGVQRDPHGSSWQGQTGGPGTQRPVSSHA
jgi:hypothetical protein